MHEQHPNPPATAAQAHELVGVVPQTFEPGVYGSRAPLPSPEKEARVIEAYRPESTTRAIGMAALPEEYKSQQLTSLTYNGLTSEQYAARHNTYLAEVSAREQQTRDVMRNLEQQMMDDDDEAEDRRGFRQRRDRLVGAKR